MTMKDSGAMTQEELDRWTEDLFQDEIGADYQRTMKPQPFWIAVFILLGFVFAALFVWVLYFALTRCVDDDLGAVTSEDVRLHYSTNKNNSAEGEGANSGLIDDTSGKCAVCREKKKGGSSWKTSGFGGCGYLVCNDCYVNYRPLEERCVMCGQFYCYRRGRVTFSDLEKESTNSVRTPQGKAAVQELWRGDDGDKNEEGLRRRHK